MKLETERLILTEFTADMAYDVYRNSLDSDTRRFVPDEVFETPEDARNTIDFLMSKYDSPDGPFVYPVLRKADRRNIGYVQIAPVENGKWEIGYHIAEAYTGNGYATEAVRAFLPVMADKIGISEVYGICLEDNKASVRVLKKCGFRPVFEGPGIYQGENRRIFRSVRML